MFRISTIRILVVLVVICLGFRIISKSAVAYYDPRTVPNNLYGLHILDPSELSSVPDFVNNHGGDWGYVTVPIQPSDRDKAKWKDFMETSSRLHLIPIIRITTIPLGGTWGHAVDTDLVDFANFLNELPWPIQNRYVILFNEVNRSTEWGGKVDPAAYALIVKNAWTIFKERSPDFFLLGPALDNALATTSTSLSSSSYLQTMEKNDPKIWDYFDGWASHSYPNPGFTGSPYKTGWQSLVSYRTELFVRNQQLDKPVFITETGWDQKKLSQKTLETYWSQAFKIWNNDPNVVAVTPFVLQGGDQFSALSLISSSGELNPSGTILQNMTKSIGTPILNSLQSSTPSPFLSIFKTDSHTPSPFSRYSILLKLENLFRQLLGLQKKANISLSSASLTVDLATTPKFWEQGLSNRSSLPQDQGMLFIFPVAHIPEFWMKDMLFPIDIIWLKDNEIISIDKNVPVSDSSTLPTYSPSQPVDMVLEVPAGYCDSHDLIPGVKLTIYD
ncbi:MAG: DUF192 domain-containing protein [bacterium]